MAEKELLAIVSHDMKNPLGALRITARHLLKQPPIELGPGARRQGEFISRTAQRMESGRSAISWMRRRSAPVTCRWSVNHRI